MGVDRVEFVVGTMLGARAPHACTVGYTRVHPHVHGMRMACAQVGMLIALGVEVCGAPLTWADVRPFLLKVIARLMAWRVHP